MKKTSPLLCRFAILKKKQNNSKSSCKLLIEVVTNKNLFGCSLFRHSQLAKLVTPSFYTLSMEARATACFSYGDGHNEL